MTQKTKPPKQTHLEYLLTTMEKDLDEIIRNVYPVFRQARDNLVARTMTADDVRYELTWLRNDVVLKAKAKHHTEKLLDATIDYIINPDKILEL